MTTPQRKKRWQQYADMMIDSAYPAVNALMSPVVDPIMQAAQQGTPPEWMQNAGESAYNVLSGGAFAPQPAPQMPQQPPMVAQADIPQAPPLRQRRKRGRMHNNMLAQR